MLRQTREKLDALRVNLERAYNNFTEVSLSAVKAEGDAESLERRIRDLKAKIARPEPQQSMGAAINTMFGCDEILSRQQIVDMVAAERDKILKKFRGLPDESTIPVSRRVILDVTWKH